VRQEVLADEIVLDHDDDLSKDVLDPPIKLINYCIVLLVLGDDFAYVLGLTEDLKDLYSAQRFDASAPVLFGILWLWFHLYLHLFLLLDLLLVGLALLVVGLEIAVAVLTPSIFFFHQPNNPLCMHIA
jgi:hypothetical protein